MAGQWAAIQHPQGESCQPSCGGVQVPGRPPEQGANLERNRKEALMADRIIPAPFRGSSPHRLDARRLAALLETRTYRTGVTAVFSPLGGWFLQRGVHHV